MVIVNVCVCERERESERGKFKRFGGNIRGYLGEGR